VRHRNVVFLALALGLAACARAAQAPVTLKIGVLPILDALPMYAADSEGYFKQQGLDVQFIPVASAAERDQLMQAGQIDGMINDLVSTLFYNKDTTQIVVVRFARVATAKYPQYRILAAKGSGIQKVADLRGVPIGVSQGTVIEYVTDRLLTAEGLSPDDIKIIAVPKIPDRLSLLQSGQLKAATLPDPLSDLGIQSGATVVLDDTTHPEYGNSVFSFRKSVVDSQPQAIRGFLLAIEKATGDVNTDKTKWGNLLTEKNLVPAPVMGSYTLPDFPTASVPTQAQFADALDWAKAKGLVTGNVSFDASVSSAYLP
jgi:NitT/TauT family transport system substrate-binding protein